MKHNLDLFYSISPVVVLGMYVWGPYPAIEAPNKVMISGDFMLRILFCFIKMKNKNNTTK